MGSARLGRSTSRWTTSAAAGDGAGDSVRRSSNAASPPVAPNMTSVTATSVHGNRPRAAAPPRSVAVAEPTGAGAALSARMAFDACETAIDRSWLAPETPDALGTLGTDRGGGSDVSGAAPRVSNGPVHGPGIEDASEPSACAAAPRGSVGGDGGASAGRGAASDTRDARDAAAASGASWMIRARPHLRVGRAERREATREHPDVRQTVRRILLEALRDEALDLGRHRRDEGDQRLRRVRDDALATAAGHRPRVERALAGEELEQDHAERPNVGCARRRSSRSAPARATCTRVSRPRNRSR